MKQRLHFLSLDAYFLSALTQIDEAYALRSSIYNVFLGLFLNYYKRLRMNKPQRNLHAPQFPQPVRCVIYGFILARLIQRNRNPCPGNVGWFVKNGRKLIYRMTIPPLHPPKKNNPALHSTAKDTPLSASRTNYERTWCYWQKCFGDVGYELGLKIASSSGDQTSSAMFWPSSCRAQLR